MPTMFSCSLHLAAIALQATVSVIELLSRGGAVQQSTETVTFLASVYANSAKKVQFVTAGFSSLSDVLLPTANFLSALAAPVLDDCSFDLLLLGGIMFGLCNTLVECSSQPFEMTRAPLLGRCSALLLVYLLGGNTAHALIGYLMIVLVVMPLCSSRLLDNAAASSIDAVKCARVARTCTFRRPRNMRRFRQALLHDAWVRATGGHDDRLRLRNNRGARITTTDPAIIYANSVLDAQRYHGAPAHADALAEHGLWLCQLLGLSSLTDVPLWLSFAPLHALVHSCTWMVGACTSLAAAHAPLALTPLAAPMILFVGLVFLRFSLVAHKAERHDFYGSRHNHLPDLTPPLLARAVCESIFIVPLESLSRTQKNCFDCLPDPCLAIDSVLHYFGLAPTEFDDVPRRPSATRLCLRETACSVLESSLCFLCVTPTEFDDVPLRPSSTSAWPHEMARLLETLFDATLQLCNIAPTEFDDAQPAPRLNIWPHHMCAQTLRDIARLISASCCIRDGPSLALEIAAFNRLVRDGRTHPHPGHVTQTGGARRPQSQRQNANRERVSESDITQDQRSAHERVTIDMIAMFDRHFKSKTEELSFTLHAIDATDPNAPYERLFTVKTSKRLMRESMFTFRPSGGRRSMACHEFDCTLVDNQTGDVVTRVSLPQIKRRPTDLVHETYTFLALDNSKFGSASGAVRWREVKGDSWDSKFDGDDNVPTERMLHKLSDKKRWAIMALSTISGYSNFDEEHRTRAAHSLLSLPKLHLRTLRGKASTTLRNTFRNKQLAAPDANCFLEQISARFQEKTLSEDGATVIERSAQEIDEARIRRARQLVIDGFIGKAAALLMQGPQPKEQAIADVIDELEKLHPKGDVPPVPKKELIDSWKTIAPVTQAELRAACNDGLQQSAPGAEGWTEELLSYVLESDDTRSIDDICAFLTDISRAQIHESVAARLRAAILVGIPKPNGSTRPIACGCMFMKLASRIALKRDEHSLRGRFGELQRGVSTPNGAGIIIHRTRAFARKMGASSKSILALDFSNAFNCPARDHMQLHCSLHRHLAPLFHVEYRSHGNFFIRGSPGVARFQSERGARQGTTGPAFFSLTIHRMLEELEQLDGVHCEGAYLDDIAICCDSPAAAKAAYTLIEKRSAEMKLKLNDTKCELMTGDAAAYSSFNANIKRVRCLKLLGAAVGLNCTEEKGLLRTMYHDKFLPLFRRLKKMPNVQGLITLSMAGIPKLSHVIRCHEPAVCIDIASEFDAETLATWQQWALCEADDLSRAFAALPVKRGGLGLTPQLEILEGAYLASRDSALGSTDGVAISQKARTAEVMDRIERLVDEQGPHIVRHRQHNMARHSSAAFRSPGLVANPAFWSGALRWRLFAPIAGLPASPSCPAGDSCTKPPFSDRRDWMRHSAVCTHVSGHGVCARHAAVKVAFKQFLHRNLISFDHAEPRDVRFVTCHCKKDIVESDLVEHVRACTAYQQRGLASTPLRGSGPDIRVYFSPAEGIDSICVDVTVTSAEADSNCNVPLDKLFDDVAKIKHAKYDDMMKRRNEQLIVIAFSESGTPNLETSNLVRKICSRSGANEFEELKRLAADVAIAHGGALHNAERRAGIYVDHEKWTPARGVVRHIALSPAALDIVLPPPNPARPGAERLSGADLAPMSHLAAHASRCDPRSLLLPRAREPSPPRRRSDVVSITSNLAAADDAAPSASAATGAPAAAAAASAAKPSGDAAASAASSGTTTTIITNNNNSVHHHHHHAAAAATTNPAAAAAQPAPVEVLPIPEGLNVPLTPNEFLAVLSPRRTRFKTGALAVGVPLSGAFNAYMGTGKPATPHQCIEFLVLPDACAAEMLRATIAYMLTDRNTRCFQANGESLIPIVQNALQQLHAAKISINVNAQHAAEVAQFLLGMLLQLRVSDPHGAINIVLLTRLNKYLQRIAPDSALQTHLNQLVNYFDNLLAKTPVDTGITVTDEIDDDDFLLLESSPKQQQQQQQGSSRQQAGALSSAVVLTAGTSISRDGAAAAQQ